MLTKEQKKKLLNYVKKLDSEMGEHSGVCEILDTLFKSEKLRKNFVELFEPSGNEANIYKHFCGHFGCSRSDFLLNDSFNIFTDFRKMMIAFILIM